MPPGGIPTYNLSRKAAVDLRLRLRGNWDCLIVYLVGIIIEVFDDISHITRKLEEIET